MNSTTCPADTATEIRTAYQARTNQGTYWMTLTELRACLPHIPRAELDATLKAMNRTPEMNLVPESNQKALSPEDWDAALRLGGEWKHMFCLGR